MRLERGTRQCGALPLPVARGGRPPGGPPGRASPRRTGGPGRSASRGVVGRIPQPARPLVRPGVRGGDVGGARNRIVLLAVAHEAGLHEQLDVAVRVGAGDVEARRCPLGALAQEVLDEPVADVPGVGHADRVELHDRPFVADGLALDPDQAGDPALLLVHEQQVVRPEGAERQAEEREDTDRRAVDRQAERPRVDAVRLAQPGQLAEGGEVGQARGTDLAGASGCGRSSVTRRPLPPAQRGASGAAGARTLRPGRRARRPSSPRGGGSASRRPAPGGRRWR